MESFTWFVSPLTSVIARPLAEPIPRSCSVPSGLGDEPPEKSTTARVLSNREPSELRRNEKRTRDLREKLEVRCDPHSLSTTLHADSTAE